MLTIFMLMQMLCPRDIVIYWPDPRGNFCCAKALGLGTHFGAKAPGCPGGMVTGQIDTCINLDMIHFLCDIVHFLCGIHLEANDIFTSMSPGESQFTHSFGKSEIKSPLHKYNNEHKLNIFSSSCFNTYRHIY